ncbi:unnamed protein product [Polarella glacialis]|uniref:Ubiquitin-like domain-containing protein n=1 Tax=Polarella glacialis TaxID=89957 RepID=A0A813GUJ4_POLGL|nr:unnamed protein product [Polarella glacialis]
MSVNLTIKPIQAPAGAIGDQFQLSIDGSATIEEMKAQVAEKVRMPVSHIRLVCAGRIWQDSNTVGSYTPSDGSIVHCLNNPPREGAAITPDQVGGIAPANPMAQMMGGMGGGQVATPGSGGGDPFQQMMAQTQQQMMQNPEMMQQLMSSPMMQQMMSNPEVLRGMVRMNPQLNELMERRPEIARMLEDPELLQQSMRMMANPSLMREMTRNADRSMANLDTMPGGHNALASDSAEVAALRASLVEVIAEAEVAALRASLVEATDSRGRLAAEQGAVAPSPVAACLAESTAA